MVGLAADSPETELLRCYEGLSRACSRAMAALQEIDCCLVSVEEADERCTNVDHRASMVADAGTLRTVCVSVPRRNRFSMHCLLCFLGRLYPRLRL